MRLAPTAVVSDSRFRHHQPGPHHPESPERSAVVETAVREWNGPALRQIAPRIATPSEILRAHDEQHLAQMEATRLQPLTRIDPDTIASESSYHTALEAVGGLLEVVDAVDSGAARNGFAFVRPPGHHANRAISQGFCLFNNVAIAALHLRRKYDRIAIIDFDVHHGNGTEEIFYEDPHVLYASVHESPWYPGTGAANDIGRGRGVGYNINLPLMAGAGDAEVALLFNDLLLPALRAFSPEFILVSAGFDGHHRDQIANLQFTETGYLNLMTQLQLVAEDTADGRIAAVLEGGYDLPALRSSAEACLTALTSTIAAAPWQAPAHEATGPLRDLHRHVGPLASTKPAE